MSTIKPELIHITTLNVYKAAVETSEEYLEDPVKAENIKVEYGHQAPAYNLEENAIRIRLEILLCANNEDEKPLGLNAQYGIEFHFIVDNLEDFIVQEEEEIQIKGLLWSTLMSIAYSTARGIVFDRTQGTFFKGVILPVIDPKKLTE